MGGGRARILAALVLIASIVAVLRPAQAAADPPLVYPGMEIHQDVHVCTLGYVDMAKRIAYTAGHCRGGGGVVTDRDRDVIGQMATFRDDTPSGSTVATDQPISDYETIVLNPAVAVSNILPGGRRLDAGPTGLTPGQPVCHFGVITQETCGTVEGVNNGWFTMSHGVTSQKGDSGGPVYLTPSDGTAQLVGIFNSVWGDFPAAVSWQTTSAMAHSDMR